MESRAFIRAAGELIVKINETQRALVSADEHRATREFLQREITSVFTGLQNPTLPSAYKLRDAALRAGYQVSSLVLQKIMQAEAAWN